MKSKKKVKKDISLEEKELIAKKKERRNTVILIIFNLLIVGIFVAAFYIAPKYIKKDISIKNNVVFELNKEIKIKDAFKAENGITITNKDELIDTSKTGDLIVKVKYRKNGHNKFLKFNVDVKDTLKPKINCDDEIKIFAGTEDDFTDYIEVTDNSNKSITPIISGDYDLSIPGEYTLSISAKDESGNEAKKDVKLIVEELKLKTTGYYVYKEKDTWHEFGFHKNNKAGYYPWFCPGFGCGGYSETGTYEIKGNRIILTLTQSTGDFGETKKINNTYEFIYVNENELNYDGEIYKWQKSFDGK